MLPTHVLPTRLHRCLDHIILKSPYSAVTLVLDSLITDHAPIIFSVAMTPSRGAQKSSTRLKLDIPAVVRDIELTDFSLMFLFNNANDAAQELVNLISSIIQKHSCKVNVPSKKRIIKPWITPGLLRCIRHRDHLYRKFSKNKQNLTLKVTFSRYRNFCNNLLKKVKREYERNELQKARSNLKDTWKVVKKMANLNRKQASSEELLKLSSDPKTSVNMVNQFFASVGKELASNINLSVFLYLYIPPKSHLVFFR